MTIRQRLRGLVGIPLCLAVVLGGLVWLSYLDSRHAVSHLRTATDISRTVFELDMVTREFTRSGSGRAAAQWRTLHRRLGVLLLEIGDEPLWDREVLPAMHHDYVRLRPLFEDLVATSQTRESVAGDDWRNRLIGQVQTRTHALIGGATQIQAASIEKVSQGQRQALAGMVAAVGILMLVAVAVVVATAQSILKPLETLAGATRQLTAGDYHTRLRLRGADELTALADAFNLMAASVEDADSEMRREMRVRRDAEQWAIQEKDRAERYLEVSKVITVELDAYRQVARINPAGCQLLGLAANEIVGRDWFKTVVPEDHRAAAMVVFQAMLDGSSSPAVHTESPVVGGGGEERLIAWNHAVLRGADGGFVGMLSSGVDVTEQRRAARELRRHRDELEELVKERTADLERVNARLREEAENRQQAQLELAAKAAELERSNAELEQFAYVTSHDLQEPLRGISGCLQLLVEDCAGTLAPENVELIDHAVRNAQRMKQLILDLLQLSRVGTRGHPLHPHDLNAVLQQALENLHTAITEAAARIDVGPLPTVVGDASQLVRLFQNLVGNAIKFRGEGPCEVRLRAVREDGQWHLSVADNGIGFDPGFKDRIFVVFQRLHGRQSYPGTGIGLALCKKIVERHGGCIWAESSPGHGATFHFTLPDKEVTEDDAPSSSH